MFSLELGLPSRVFVVTTELIIFLIEFRIYQKSSASCLLYKLFTVIRKMFPNKSVYVLTLDWQEEKKKERYSVL